MPPSDDRSLGWRGADNRHNMSLPPEVRNSRGNELWDHYSVGADLGPVAGPILGAGQELFGRPFLARYPGVANTVLPSVFNFRTPDNSRSGAVDPYAVPTARESWENFQATVRGAWGLQGPRDTPPTGAASGPQTSVDVTTGDFRVDPEAANPSYQIPSFLTPPPLPPQPSTFDDAFDDFNASAREAGGYSLGDPFTPGDQLPSDIGAPGSVDTGIYGNREDLPEFDGNGDCVANCGPTPDSGDNPAGPENFTDEERDIAGSNRFDISSLFGGGGGGSYGSNFFPAF